MIKTVLELDLVGYSTIAATLEQGLSVDTVDQLNEQIQSFVDIGLQQLGVTRAATVMQTTGDGAILVFDQPTQAVEFAETVHQATRTHNASKPPGIGKRVFRIGIATGDLVMKPKASGGFDIAGMTIARAVRLEAKAKPGEVLCDPESYAGLPKRTQKQFAPVETIAGKRDETFQAHRCVFNSDALQDAEFFAGSKPSPEATRTKNPIPPSELNRRVMLACLKQLRYGQYEDLIFLLNVPIPERPSETLSLANKTKELLKWVEEHSRLTDLWDELQLMLPEFVASHPQ